MPASRWSSMSTPPWSLRTARRRTPGRRSRGYGFHPLCAFVDHGGAGTGEPLSIMLRPGNAGSNTALDHIAVISAALRQLPGNRRGKQVLVRIDGAGSTHKVIDWLTGRRLSYSVGFTLPENTPDLLRRIPEHVWTPAYDAVDEVRDGAWVTALTDLLHRSRPATRPRAAPPAPGPLRGPHPHRQGHRPDQPAADLLQRQPDLVRRRGPGRRHHRLDADARLRRHRGPSMGTQEAALPDLHHPRDPGPQRAAGLAAPVRPITLGRNDPNRAGQTGRPRPRLSRSPPSRRPPRDPRPWNRRPPGRHRDAVSHPQSRITHTRHQNCPTPPASRHRERSRLVPRQRTKPGHHPRSERSSRPGGSKVTQVRS